MRGCVVEEKLWPGATPVQLESLQGYRAEFCHLIGRGDGSLYLLRPFLNEWLPISLMLLGLTTLLSVTVSPAAATSHYTQNWLWAEAQITEVHNLPIPCQNHISPFDTIFRVELALNIHTVLHLTAASH